MKKLLCTAPGVEWTEPDHKGVRHLLKCRKPAKLVMIGEYGGYLCDHHAKMIAALGIVPQGDKAFYIA